MYTSTQLNCECNLVWDRKWEERLIGKLESVFKSRLKLLAIKGNFI